MTILKKDKDTLEQTTKTDITREQLDTQRARLVDSLAKIDELLALLK